jgi:uncharacterized protein YdhG (YjbR/CyaY superfamily)
MPAFRLNGKLIAGFRSAANHCSFHPMSGATVATLKAELAGHDTSPGTIRFSTHAGLPATLVGKLVKARIAEQRSSSSGPYAPPMPSRYPSLRKRKAAW